MVASRSFCWRSPDFRRRLIVNSQYRERAQTHTSLISQLWAHFAILRRGSQLSHCFRRAFSHSRLGVSVGGGGFTGAGRAGSEIIRAGQTGSSWASCLHRLRARNIYIGKKSNNRQRERHPHRPTQNNNRLRALTLIPKRVCRFPLAFERSAPLIARIACPAFDGAPRRLRWPNCFARLLPVRAPRALFRPICLCRCDLRPQTPVAQLSLRAACPSWWSRAACHAGCR